MIDAVHDVRQVPESPTVSVITVSFNSRGTIRQTLESVLAQTYPHVEHVVVDGGSTDGTTELLRTFERPGFVWSSGRDRGMYDAMNKGMAVASGQIVGILNSDDWLEPEAIESVVKCFSETGCDYTFGDAYLADQSGVRFGLMRSIDPLTMGDEYLYKMPVTHQTCYVSREMISRIGEYCLDYKLSADHDFVVRLIRAGAQGGRLPIPIANYRMGGRGGGVRTFQESRDIAIRYGKSVPWAYRRYMASLAKIALVQVLPRPVMSALLRMIGSRHVWS